MAGPRGSPPQGCLYIGRGNEEAGVPHSKWANPYRIGVHGTREGVCRLYHEHLSSSGLRRDLGELAGLCLLCHCAMGEQCHGDVLLEACRQEDEGKEIEGEVHESKGKESVEGIAMADFVDDGLPVRIVEEKYGEDVKEKNGEVEPPDTAEPSGKPRWPGEEARGWLGRGPTRKAPCMGRDRAFWDGGGLCSPGRWPPDRRRLPEARPGLMSKIREVFQEGVRRTAGDGGDGIAFMIRLAAGEFADDPFPEEFYGRIRDLVADEFGMEAIDYEVAERQCFRLRMLSKVLRAFGDPDWEFVIGLESGVSLGVSEELPRAEAIFEEKSKWKLEDDGAEPEVDRSNYASLEPHREKVEALFKEEADLGWMVEMAESEAKAKYGDKLHIASLAVVEEKDKIRVVHDASHGVHINHRIKVRDQLRCPGAGEIKHLFREKRDAGSKTFMVLADVSKAHRRIKVKEADWGYQACRTREGRVWLNTVGTYGLAPAGYYWGRLAAAVIVRLPYYLVGHSWGAEFLLYADDWLGLASEVGEVVELGVILVTLMALGVPFKWKKFRGGSTSDWIGYWLDSERFLIGISESRADWLCRWMEERVREGRVDVKEFTQVLGRLGFALGPLEFLRPFISPMYSWVSAVGDKGRVQLPWSMAFLFSFLVKELRGPGRIVEILPRGPEVGMAFRADAKAEGQLVRVGAWECVGGCPPREARWFALELTKANAPGHLSEESP